MGFGFTTSNINAQATGKITGKVVESDFGEGLIGANVFIEGTTLGAATDIEGNYTIVGIQPGKYNVIFSSIGYAKQTVTGVEIKDGKTAKLDIVMKTESFETEEVIVAAEAVTNTEAALLAKRQKSISVILFSSLPRVLK